MKGFTTKAATLVMATSLVIGLSACGSNKNNSGSSLEAPSSAAVTTEPSKSAEPVTLKLWHQWASPNDGNTKAFRAAIDEWNKNNPDIQVEDDGIDGESYKTKIKTAIAANEAPDIFYAWGAGFAKPFVEANAVLPLDDYLTDGTSDKLLPGSLTNVTYDGKVYGLPTSLSVASLYVNKEMFDQNGIKVPTTFNELLDAVKAFRAKGITPITVGEKDLWPGMYWYDIMAIRTAGAQDVQNALSNTASFDTQPYKDAAAKLQELVDAKAFNTSLFSNGYNEMVSDFTQGKAAMCFQGNWLGGSVEDENSLVKGKVIAIPFPTIDGGKGTSDEFFGGAIDALWVSANTKHKDEAVKVIKFLTEQMSNKLYEAGAGLPSWKVSGVDESKISPLTKQTMDMMKNATNTVMWWDIFLEGKDADTHKNLVAQVFDGKITPDAYAVEMQKINSSKQ
ncbi:extracellular solute-binding protein [Cohnella yongneupensis]|uniref:Extracellular solute-binding protein n=1 Tax=Cohnella yongneupensis TaxID=425006 RepID=A0ABW0R6G6_9BACL